MRLRTIKGASRAAGRAGFTLMELLVVVAILLVLAGVATPMYMSYLEKSKMKRARVDAITLSGELKRFALDHNGEYPPQGMWDMLSLDGPNPPLDPWNNPYNWMLVQKPTAELVLEAPVVWSWGPNKSDEGGSGDDITSQ